MPNNYKINNFFQSTDGKFIQFVLCFDMTSRAVMISLDTLKFLREFEEPDEPLQIFKKHLDEIAHKVYIHTRLYPLFKIIILGKNDFS